MNFTMNFRLIVAVALLAFAPGTRTTIAQDGVESPSDTQATQESSSADSAIRESAKKFVADFNRGDAAAVAAHWTTDGTYIDEIGETYAGREAIEKEYKSFFAAYPKIQMTVSVDSVHEINDNTVIEHGRATLGPQPDGPPAHSRYTAVHIRKDGEWQMSHVRDSRVEIESHHNRLADLEYLIGTWHMEGNGRHVELTCSWQENKNHLERVFTVRENDKVISSTKEMVGWDPKAESIVSTTFTSDGGKAVGYWSPHEAGWVIESVGVSADGSTSSSMSLLAYVDEDAVTWESIERVMNGAALPDLKPIVLKRK